jgi:hypothetical protein
MRMHLLILASSSLGACHRADQPGVPSAPASTYGVLAYRGGVTGSSAGSDEALSALAAEDVPVFRRASIDTRDVITSDAFHQALAAMEPLEISAGGPWLTGEAVDLIYRGKTALKSLPVCYLRADGSGRETANTGIGTQCGNTKGRYAITSLHWVVLQRLGQLPEGHGCAINTLAHEWTHSIVEPDTGAKQVFTDAGYQHHEEPIVSYTVGAVAQCVYLRRWRPLLDIDTCVRTVGTHGFAACTCAAGWLDAFIAGTTSCK